MECGSQSEQYYRSLLADFQAAYCKMRTASEAFSAAIAAAPGPEPPEERKSRIKSALADFESARDEFQQAAGALNHFLVGAGVRLIRSS
jgi:hypothetical protein